MSEEGRIVHHYHESNRDEAPPPPPPVIAQYGTFEGIPSSPAMAMGFPQPTPPPGSMNPPPPPDYYTRGYQAVPGYAVADGTPVGSHHRLPCCGIGFGWFLFILGFFVGGIPWYFAAIVFLGCRNVDPREKPAYVCCTIAAVLAIIATVFGVTKLND